MDPSNGPSPENHLSTHCQHPILGFNVNPLIRNIKNTIIAPYCPQAQNIAWALDLFMLGPQHYILGCSSTRVIHRLKTPYYDRGYPLTKISITM